VQKARLVLTSVISPLAVMPPDIPPLLSAPIAESTLK